MSSIGFEAQPGWTWPDDIPGYFNSAEERPGSTSTEQQESPPKEQAEQAPPPPRRHYPPRQCRICLEVVYLTFKQNDTPSEHLPSVFQPAPSVVYESEEGRMLRPCKCKGSSKYVHESCLQAWRHADPGYGRRNYWQCPTCGFRYRLERMQWGRLITSKVTQISLTVSILIATMFVLGFIADPIINLYLDPVTTISSVPMRGDVDPRFIDEEESSWTFHFLKGLASLGLLGFAKFFFTLNPFQWFQIRNSGMMSGSARAGATGRDRLANISWVVVVIGVGTALYGVWKLVRNLSRRFLEKAGERVMDVHGEEGDDDEDDVTAAAGQ